MTSACGSGTSTSPSTTPSTNVEQFVGSLDLMASVPYSFSVPETTNVEVTFASLTDVDANVSNAVIALSVGTPQADASCLPTVTKNTAAALASQLQITLNPGAYCVNVADIGNLATPSVFAVRIVEQPPIQVGTGSSTTDTFTSNIAVGGTTTRTFTASRSGTVTVTLQSVSPNSTLGVGLGIPSLAGTGCSLTRFVRTAGSGTPQITAPVDLGSYCVRVSDVGSLILPPSGTATFTLVIVHP